MDMDLNIEKICGTSAISPDFESIANDPSFIFEPDANYTTVVLYNSEGSVINVNSWLECANYVNGGWSSIVQTGYIGTLVLLQITAVLYLGYGFMRFINKSRSND